LTPNTSMRQLFFDPKYRSNYYYFYIKQESVRGSYVPYEILRHSVALAYGDKFICECLNYDPWSTF